MIVVYDTLNERTVAVFNGRAHAEAFMAAVRNAHFIIKT